MSNARYTIAAGVAATSYTGTREAVLAHARKLSVSSTREIEVRDQGGAVLARFRVGVEMQAPRAVGARPAASSTATATRPRAVPATGYAVARLGRVVGQEASEARAIERATAESTGFPGEIVTVYDARGKIVRSFLRGSLYQGPPPEPVPTEWVDAPKPKKKR